MKRIAWLLCALLVTATGRADEVFAHPQSAQQLLSGLLAAPTAAQRNAAVMRGRFVYRRYLTGIPQPLVSRGDFTFARELGIDWHTRQPFDSDFVLTAAGITQRDDGRVSAQLDAGDVPAVRIVARIFLALLSLDVGSLESTFALSGVQDGAQWQVGLKPTVPAIAGVFRDAILSGAAQVQRLQLRDANGDRSEIEFSELQYAPRVAEHDRQAIAPAGRP